MDCIDHIVIDRRTTRMCTVNSSPTFSRTTLCGNTMPGVSSEVRSVCRLPLLLPTNCTSYRTADFSFNASIGAQANLKVHAEAVVFTIVEESTFACKREESSCEPSIN